jgi:hypothetical protein
MLKIKTDRPAYDLELNCILFYRQKTNIHEILNDTQLGQRNEMYRLLINNYYK